MDPHRLLTVHGRAGIAPFRSADDFVQSIVALVTSAGEEGFGPGLRSPEVAAARLAATREGPPYVGALRAWSLDATTAWFLHAALVYELVPGRDPPTVEGCARVASAITGAPRTTALAAATTLARLELAATAGDAPLHARVVRASPRVVDIALSDVRPPGPIAIVTGAAHDVPAELAARVERALGPSQRPVRVGAPVELDAIVAALARFGLAAAIASPRDAPATVVREALLAEATIVVTGEPASDAAWSLQQAGAMYVGA